jgi:hypothetical protein
MLRSAVDKDWSLQEAICAALQSKCVTMQLSCVWTHSKAPNIHRFGLNENFKAAVIPEAPKGTPCTWDAFAGAWPNAHGNYFNGLYCSVQNNPQMGFIWTSPILHNYQMSNNLNVSQLLVMAKFLKSWTVCCLPDSNWRYPWSSCCDSPFDDVQCSRNKVPIIIIIIIMKYLCR